MGERKAATGRGGALGVCAHIYTLMQISHITTDGGHTDNMTR